MKKSKSKSRERERGFTLIELMVVISIISLLSSVVLASVSAARQKAENAKIVSEMKSIQTALELYRNQFGVYPQTQGDEDDNDTTSAHSGTSNSAGYAGGWNNFVKTYLVDNKFLSKVPQSKNYPNNCINSDCYYGNTYFYTSAWSDSNVYLRCGEQKVTGYLLGYVTTEDLNLPKATTYFYGSIFSVYIDSYADPYPTDTNIYCLGM